MARPFEGIRIVDLTHVLAGPFCTYQLALLGADVIKVEPPQTPDATRGRGPDDRLNAMGLGLTYQVQGANKRAISIDLRAPEGKSVFLRLLEDADVLVENYRAGALAELGLDTATLKKVNSRLIICSLTGFGQTGGRAGRNAYDNVVQAASGIMHQSRDRAGVPQKLGASVIDYAAGLNAAFAIASALLRREREGTAQVIDCAMLDMALLTMAPELAASLHAAPKTKRPNEAGLGCYETADGLLMLGAFNPRQNARLWNALGVPEFAALKDWPDLWDNAEAMRTRLLEIMPTRTAAEWEDFFDSIGVPAERVRTLDEAARLPQLAERGFVAELPNPADGSSRVHVPLAAFRCDMDGPAIDRPPPRFGGDTNEVLLELGYNPAEIDAMRSGEAIA